jgi:hypothetical protein
MTAGGAKLPCERALGTSLIRYNEIMSMTVYVSNEPINFIRKPHGGGMSKELFHPHDGAGTKAI